MVAANVILAVALLLLNGQSLLHDNRKLDLRVAAGLGELDNGGINDFDNVFVISTTLIAPFDGVRGPY
jgi:hypothetical protein